MKKLLLICLIAICSLSMTFAQGSSEAKVTTKDLNKPYAGTKIRVLSMTAQVSDGIQAYLGDFTKKTGIEVELELYGEAELRQKELTEFMAGSSTVDAFLMSPLQDLGVFSKNKWIEPLNSYLTDPELGWDDFTAPKEQITILGSDSVGCLPLYSSVQLMYYRKDIFKEKGVQIPKTYDELIEVCKQLNNPKNNFYAVGMRGEKIALTSQFSPILFSFGGSYIKDGKSNFNSPESIAATQFYGELLGKYGPPGVLTAGYSQMTQLFNSGTVAMVIDANALYATLIDKAQSSYADQVGVASIPKGVKGMNSYKQVVWGASIYSGSKNKEAAWEFLKFVAGKDVAAFITPKGMPSFRASVWADERVKSAMPDDLMAAYAEISASDTLNQYGLPRMTNVTEARDAMGAAVVYSIETKGEGPDLSKKMQEAADKVDNLLKKAKEYGDAYNW